MNNLPLIECNPADQSICGSKQCPARRKMEGMYFKEGGMHVALQKILAEAVKPGLEKSLCWLAAFEGLGMNDAQTREKIRQVLDSEVECDPTHPLNKEAREIIKNRHSEDALMLTQVAHLSNQGHLTSLRSARYTH